METIMKMEKLKANEKIQKSKIKRNEENTNVQTEMQQSMDQSLEIEDETQ